MLMGVDRCFDCQLGPEGLVGCCGQEALAWAPPQWLQTCRSLQELAEQPRSLKLLQTICFPQNSTGRPRRSGFRLLAG